MDDAATSKAEDGEIERLIEQLHATLNQASLTFYEGCKAAKVDPAEMLVHLQASIVNELSCVIASAYKLSRDKGGDRTPKTMLGNCKAASEALTIGCLARWNRPTPVRH